VFFIANTTTSKPKNIPISENGAINPCHNPEKKPYSVMFSGNSRSTCSAQELQKIKIVSKIRMLENFFI
jgi:hypothetical protein